MAGLRSEVKRTLTTTEVKFATVEIIEGEAKISESGNEVLSGDVSADKALKLLQKSHGVNVTILSATPKTESYAISVLDFIKYGHVVEEDKE